MNNNRFEDIKSFYDILNRCKKMLGLKLLSDSNGYMSWPQRGVYFFFEEGEFRSDTGSGMRVTRIGTHALKNNSKTTLWKRLSQHKGVVKSKGGNHRGSIFRLLLGDAIIKRDSLIFPNWSIGSSASKEIRDSELELERLVSTYIGNMPFICLPINDSPGPDSFRNYIEGQSIALISNYRKEALDNPSNQWLGQYSTREKVSNSGLWNQMHVNKHHDNNFIATFDNYVKQLESLI